MQLNRYDYKPLKWMMILVAVAGLFLTEGCNRGHGEQAASAPVPEVATASIEPRPVELTTELPGRTSPYRVAEIRPQVNGLIQKRYFREGSDVKAGQLLYQIDPAPFQAVYHSAQASLAKAQANLPSIRSRAERYKDLLTDNAVSQQDYDDAAASLEQVRAEIECCKAQVETARINLGYTRVTAPISGRIGRSNVTEGAIVTAYQAEALATIQQLDPIYVDVPQSTTDLLRLEKRMQEGQLERNGKTQRNVRLVMEDNTAYPIEGTFQFQEVTVDQTTGSVILRAVFPNPKTFLLPGMFVRAVFLEGVNDQALLVPQQAVSRDRKGNPMVLIVSANDKVEQRMLTLDRVIGDQWLVSSGLEQGDRVIIEGLQKVRPGAAVQADSKTNKSKPENGGQDSLNPTNGGGA